MGKHQISYTAIYRAIHQGRFDMGERKASRKLRHKGKTRHTQNHLEKHGKIQISHSLTERPISAQNRSRLGHWEADTVLGKSGGACPVTLTDRKSRFELAKKVARKKAELVQEAMIELLQSHRLRSITPDRGREFAKHRLQWAIDELNLHPRKCLGWKTPYEVYFGKSLHLV